MRTGSYPDVEPTDVRIGSWPCKNTLPGKSVRSQTGSVSGHDRSHQRLDPDDVHDPCQINLLLKGVVILGVVPEVEREPGCPIKYRLTEGPLSPAPAARG